MQQVPDVSLGVSPGLLATPARFRQGSATPPAAPLPSVAGVARYLEGGGDNTNSGILIKDDAILAKYPSPEAQKDRLKFFNPVPVGENERCSMCGMPLKGEGYANPLSNSFVDYTCFVLPSSPWLCKSCLRLVALSQQAKGTATSPLQGLGAQCVTHDLNTQTGSFQPIKEYTTREDVWTVLEGWILGDDDRTIALAFNMTRKTLGLYLPLSEGRSSLLSVLIVLDGKVAQPMTVRIARDRLWRLLNRIADSFPTNDYKKVAVRFRVGAPSKTIQALMADEMVDANEARLLRAIMPVVPRFTLVKSSNTEVA